MEFRWNNRIVGEVSSFEDSGFRRHGKNDELYILPATNHRKLLTDPLFSGLLCTGAGIFFRSKGHTVNRPRGFHSHSIKFLIEGSGQFVIGGKELHLSAPAMVWLPATEAHRYNADARDPWTIAHISGSGPFMNLFMQRLGIQRGGYELLLDFTDEMLTHLVSLFSNVRKSFDSQGTMGGLYRACGHLRCLLTEILLYGQQHFTGETAHLARLNAFLHAHLNHSLTVGDMARTLRMRPRVFSKWLENQTKFKPPAYLSHLRVSAASTLLAQGLTVAEAANRVGYSDALYFSRVFKKITGRPPSKSKARLI